MIKNFVILLAVISPSLACIGGLFGGSGGCCQASAPSCSSPCGAVPPPIPSVSSAGAYVTAPAIPFQAAPVLPYAAPQPAQLPSNAYAFPEPVQQNVNVPQVGGQSNFGYASTGFAGAQLQQQQPALVPQQPLGGYITPGNIQQQTVYTSSDNSAQSHVSNVYELPTSQVHVIQPSTVVTVPQTGYIVSAPTSGVQESTHTVVAPPEQPTIDYKGVLGNNKEIKIRGKNGHNGKYGDEDGASYDDFGGYNPSDSNGEAQGPSGRTSVQSVVTPSEPRIETTVGAQNVQPVSVPIVTGPTNNVPSTNVHVAVNPTRTGSSAPHSTVTVVPSSTSVVEQTVRVVPSVPVETSKFAEPVSRNEFTDVEKDQDNTGSRAFIPTTSTAEEVAQNVKQPHSTQPTVGQKNGGLDFNSVGQPVSVTSAPENKPIAPFAPQKSSENVEELDGDDYDTLNEDRPEVPVASTFINQKEVTSEHQPTVEHISSAEQPAVPLISTAHTDVHSTAPSSNQVQIKTTEQVDVAEGFDYGDDNGANYDDVAESGKETDPLDPKDYQSEPYAGIKKAVAGTTQLENADPIDVDRIYLWKN